VHSSDEARSGYYLSNCHVANLEEGGDPKAHTFEGVQQLADMLPDHRRRLLPPTEDLIQVLVAALHSFFRFDEQAE